MLAISYFEV